MEREYSGSLSVGDPENHFRENRTFQTAGTSAKTDGPK